MNVTILGTGNMGRAIATRMLESGNYVTLFSRDAEKAGAAMRELAHFAKNSAGLKSAALGSPITDPVVINTIWYPASLEVLAKYGSQLSGKILVDISNPVNQTYDDLITPPGSSAAEEIAKVVPKDVKVIKAFNTTYAGILSQGNVAGLPADVFIAGDDDQAKATLTTLIEKGGLRAIDVGPLRRARLIESLGLLSIIVQAKLEKPWMSGIKIIG